MRIMEHTLSLKSNAVFSRLYKKGDCLASGTLIMYYAPNDLSVCRMGITVGKKIGKAVKRNRAKRLIRESYRFFEDQTSGYDIVFVARTKTPEADFSEVKKDMAKLFRKSKMKVKDR